MPLTHPVPAGTIVRYSDVANPGTTYRVAHGPDEDGNYIIVILDGPLVTPGRTTSSDLRQHGWTLVTEAPEPEPTSGTDLALAFPDTAARLVVIGDSRNAWDVLVSAYGEGRSLRMVLAVEGGKAALDALGVTEPAADLGDTVLDRDGLTWTRGGHGTWSMKQGSAVGYSETLDDLNAAHGPLRKPDPAGVTLDRTTNAFFQGVQDGTVVADATNDPETWAFFAGRAFGLRYTEQESDAAVSYVQGLNTRKPGKPEPTPDDVSAIEHYDIGRAAVLAAGSEDEGGPEWAECLAEAARAFQAAADGCSE